MSTIDPNDVETTGYFLPEDSQFRLKKLREHVEFLANLARPRIADEGKEWYAEIRPGEVAICLELLEEQIAQVLGELSWPATREKRAAAREKDAEPAATEAATGEPEAAKEAADGTDERYLYGVTLTQIDEIALLLTSLRALGNVVTTSDHAELADVTLSVMGDAIVRDVERLREIIGDVEVQELGPPYGRHAGVREERAIYHVPPARMSMMAGVSCAVPQLPVCP